MSDVAAPAEVFGFGPFTLDTRKGLLARGDDSIHLRPKAYSLLVHLARNGGRVVPKAELMDAVWPGIYVTEDSLTQSIREIRKELGDQEIVRTISRRGYMLAGKAAIAPQTAAQQQPIVAVLKFRNDSGDPAREPIVDGFAEDIITGLSHYGSITVLARNSSFQFASNEPASWGDVASRIGADYLVEGAVRWSGSDALINVSLVDAKGLRQLWGHRYEAHDVEVFAVQREIGQQIVNRLVSRLDEDSIARSAQKPTESMAAYELVTRAVAILRGPEHLQPEKAIPLLELAIEKDPAYGVAYAYLAHARFMLGRFGETGPQALQDALAIAIRAAAIAPNSAVAPRVMALLRIYLRQHEAAEADLRTAVTLNPYDADAVEHMGYLLAMRGRPLEALEWFDRAIRLNPIFPPWYHFDKAHAHFALGEYETSADLLQRPNSRMIWQDARIAACYGQMGDSARSKSQIEKIFTAFPNYPLIWIARARVPFENKDDAEHLAEGFALALGFAGIDPQTTATERERPPGS